MNKLIFHADYVGPHLHPNWPLSPPPGAMPIRNFSEKKEKMGQDVDLKKKKRKGATETPFWAPLRPRSERTFQF